MTLLSRISFLALMLTLSGQLSALFAQIPRFLPTVSYADPGATMAAVADVNRDGILDVVTANGAAPGGNGVSVLLGLGHGKFKAAAKVATGSSPSWVLVGDFNNDGKPDIAVANEPNPNVLISVTGGPAPNSVSVLFGNGDGTFQPAIDTPTAGALALGAGDFNKDGKLDLVVVTGSTTTTQILLNNGDGTFTVSDANVTGFPTVIVGDFNNDGKLDFLSGGWEMLGNGDGTFTLGQSLPVNAGLAADFNGDGIPDLAQLVPTSLGRIVTGLMSQGLADGTWAPSFISNFSGRGMVAGDFKWRRKNGHFWYGHTDWQREFSRNRRTRTGQRGWNLYLRGSRIWWRYISCNRRFGPQWIARRDYSKRFQHSGRA